MKKLVAVALSLILAISCLSGLSLTTSAAWDGGYSVDYTGGTGTEADPYLISSENDLALLAKKTNEEAIDYTGCYFKLTMDLDLGGTAWAPIGHMTGSGVTFNGTFDGDGHTIAGLNCQSENNFGGLFGKVQGATIKNLTVTGTLVSSTKYAGGIIGIAYKGSTVYNCHTAIDSIKGTTAGGIVGRTQETGEGGVFNVIKGCTTSSKVELISGKDCYGGGIVGAAGAVEVRWCINNGDVTGLEGTTKTMMLGGIIGVQGASSVTGHIYNCANTGNITAMEPDGTTAYAGGLVGRAAHVADSEIQNSFSTGVASVVDANNVAVEGRTGSLFGHIRYLATIWNCYTCIPYADCPEVAADDFNSTNEAGSVTVLTEAQMQGPDAVTNMKLGAGWVSEAVGLPSIDLANASDDTTIPEDTTPDTPDTTPAPVETTTTPTEDKETTPEDTTTAAPTTTPTEQSTTTAPAGGDSSSSDNGGPNIFVILIIVVVVLAAGAIAVVVVMDKKKKA